MNRKITVALFMLMMLFCGCDKNDNKDIKIAAFGCEGGYMDYYKIGLEKAYADVCEEYKDSGCKISFEYYDDKDDYELAAKLTSQIINDDELTAIIASTSAEICENQIYRSDKAEKILVCPHWVYDGTLEQGNYDKVFLLNNSSNDIGRVMKHISVKSPAERWAVCYSDDKISRAEIDSFKSNENVIDFVKTNALISDFDNITDRWQLLGVEGVVLIPYDNEGFDLLYELKQKMPQIYVISDSSLDDEDEVLANKEYFDRVYVTDAFFVEKGKPEKLACDKSFDTWELHGYNALRMIVDTAVLNDTNNPDEIAEILHKDGYDGDLESYEFGKNGSLEPKKISYSEYTEGKGKEHTVKINN